MTWRTVAVLVFGFALLYALFTTGFPFLLALVIAIFLEPLNRLLMKYGRMNRLASSLIVSTLFTLVMISVTYVVGVKIFTEVIEYTKRAPSYLNDLNLYIQNAMNRTQLFYETLPPELAEQTQVWLETAVRALTDTVNGMIVQISGYFFNIAKTIPSLFIFFIVFVVSVYLFTMGLPGLKRSFLGLFEERSQPKVDSVLVNLRIAIFGFLYTHLVMSAITYVLMLVGFLVLGVNYPLAMALFVVIVDILPVLGIGSVLLPWAVYWYVIGYPGLASGLIVLFLVATVVRRTVEPKVLGGAVGIGALPALISLYVGFRLFGVIGMFLGPVAVIVFQAMRRAGLIEIKLKLE